MAAKTIQQAPTASSPAAQFSFSKAKLPKYNPKWRLKVNKKRLKIQIWAALNYDEYQ
jgi:hypothetical protein